METIDRLFDRRHPGKVGRMLVAITAPMLRSLQPNDKWSTLAFLPEWVRVLDCPCHIPLSRGKRIFIFTAYRGQFTRDIVLALLLRWRGHDVTLGYLPKLQSPIKEPVLDHPSAAPFARRLMRDLERLSQRRIKTIDLSPLLDSTIGDHDEAALDAQCRADMLLRTRREHPDMSDPDTKWARSYYQQLGYRSAAMAQSFFEQNQGRFDIVVLPNGASFENAHILNAAKARGVPVTTHEKFAFAKVVVINHGDAFFHFHDIDRVWGSRREAGLSTPEAKAFIHEKAWDLLSARRGGKGGQWGWQYQSATRSRRTDEIRNGLGIGDDEFVLVCPNVPFDAGYEGWLDVFPSMRDWLVDTVRFLLARGRHKVVVRAHPAETRPGFGKETIDAILSEAGINDARLVVLPGGSPINTYDLMSICHYAVVFASTTGIEIAMHGRAVLAGANVYYARCGIVHYGATQGEYFDILGRLDDAAVPELKTSAEEAAELYFLFHYCLQWRYPYDKPSHVTATPPAETVSAGDQAQLCETLDVLAMTEEEYSAALPGLMRIEAISSRWNWVAPTKTSADSVS